MTNFSPSTLPPPTNLNTIVIGTSWLLLSSIFTTYSTTAFLKWHSFAQRDRPKALTKFKLPEGVVLGGVDDRFNIPQLLTIWRFGGSFLLSLVTSSFSNTRKIIAALPTTMPPFVFPAFYLTLANLCNVIALDKIGISLTYTTKCAIPIMTVFIQAIEDRKNLPSYSSILSLIPIAFGIALSNWNAPRFDAVGFIFAILSCTAQSFLNVSCKNAIMKTNLSGFAVQRNLVAIAFVVLGVKQFVFDNLADLIGRLYRRRGTTLLTTKKKNKTENETDADKQPHPPALLTAYMVTCYHLEYCLSFVFLSRINSVTYSVCDAIRRLCIIISGRIFFGGAYLSNLNKFGVLLAIIGACFYAVKNN